MNRWHWTNPAPGVLRLAGAPAEVRYEPRDDTDERYFVAYVNGRQVSRTDSLLLAEIAAENKVGELVRIGLLDDPRREPA